MEGKTHMLGKNVKACPEWHGSLDIDEWRARCPKGTRLRLTKDLDDPSGLKKGGDVCVVDYVDDAGNIHVLWESGGSQPFFIGVDSFEEVDKMEESKP